MYNLLNTLGYVDPTYVENLPADAARVMSMAPKIIDDWQIEDLATGNNYGYYVNPVSNVVCSMWNTANTINSIIKLTSSNTYTNTVLQNVKSIMLDISANIANNYLILTNRLSNVTPDDGNPTLPSYKNALGFGKFATYLGGYSTDTQNTAASIGCFTSLMIGNTLNSMNSSLTLYANNLSYSINVANNSIVGAPTSNISHSDALALQNVAGYIDSTLIKYYTDNINFYNNSYKLILNFASIQSVSSTNMSGAQDLLVRNFIGSPKLLSRINS